MHSHATPAAGSAMLDVLSGIGQFGLKQAGLEVVYSCMPPFEGRATTRPNRIGVIFSGHQSVKLEQDGNLIDAAVAPGSLYVVNAEPPLLRKVGEYSDILKIYPDMNLLAAMAEEANIHDVELEPTVRRRQTPSYRVDPVILCIAHQLRRVCLRKSALTDLEADRCSYLIAARVLRNQYGVQCGGQNTTLCERRLARLTDFVEAHLTTRISLDDLAGQVGISPFHFARAFKKSTGLAPHQFVTARRFDLARRMLVTTDGTVHDIALSVGYENLSHFRRQFVAQFGIGPGAMRKIVGVSREKRKFRPCQAARSVLD
jgi:AraC family transcriptional regulator